MASIELKELTFRYPGADEETLSPTSLKIENGEAFALLGASGAGKTTILNLLSGLLIPSSGRIKFNGEDVTDWSGRNRNIAQVFQFPVVYENLTIQENLSFPLRARKFKKSVIGQRVDLIANELGITELLNLKAPQLSLFQKQLVAIGRALVRPDVSVILLDEPLTAVEPSTKWLLRGLLRKLRKEQDVTMIYVTHDQTEAMTFAQRVAVMDLGKILQVGTPSQIYNSPNHTFVGYFLGSPGMNFIDIKEFNSPITAPIGTQTIGFRPEWATIFPHEKTHLSGKIKVSQLTGTRDAKPVGINWISLKSKEIAVRGSIDFELGQPINIRLDKYLFFRDGLRLTGKNDV